LIVRGVVCNHCLERVSEYRELRVVTYSGPGHISHKDPLYVLHICHDCEDEVLLGPALAREFTRMIKEEKDSE